MQLQEFLSLVNQIFALLLNQLELKLKNKEKDILSLRLENY